MKATIPPPALTGTHLRTYNAIFRHPLSHNLAWKDVYSLLGRLGQVSEEANGNLRVTRNGEILVLRPAQAKQVSEASEMMELRHFLERSAKAPVVSDEKEIHCVVVIDHHHARIFRPEVRGTLAQEILPHEPDDFFRHAHHSKDFNRGQEKPDPNSFFAPVAEALKDAGNILVFGNGKGTASEMLQFTAWLESHEPEIFARILGSHVIDQHHVTDAQLLAKAREMHLRSVSAAPTLAPSL